MNKKKLYFRIFFKDGARGLTDPDNSVFLDLYARGENLLKSGKIKGFGEFHTNNTTSGHPRIRRAIRVDNPAMRKFYSIADKYQGFVQIHAEFDKDFERDILSLSADYPNATTVLSHCLSSSNANVLASLFSKRNNITCEMSATGEVINKLLGLNKNPIAFNSSGPFDGWKKLIESYPDQVMLGTDPCCGADGGYSELVAEFRTNLLPYFSPEIIEFTASINVASLAFLLINPLAPFVSA